MVFVKERVLTSFAVESSLRSLLSAARLRSATHQLSAHFVRSWKALAYLMGNRFARGSLTLEGRRALPDYF